MAYPTIFNNLPSGTSSLSLVDTMFSVLGSMSQIMCTATGTNTIVLTPNTNMPTVASYANYQLFGFVAAATTSATVTINVSSVGAKNAYAVDGVTQLTTGDLTSGVYYLFAYNSSLNSAAGGFQIVGSSGNLTLNGLRVIQSGSNVGYFASTGATASSVVIDNQAGGNASQLIFENAGTLKWALIKDSSNNLNITDFVSGNKILNCTPSGNTVLGQYQNFFIDPNNIVTQVAKTNGNQAFSFLNASSVGVGSIQINVGGTAFNTTSDGRLKENVVPLSNASTVIDAMSPVTYDWTYIEGKPSGTGFIAQDLYKIAPEAVSVGDAGVVDDNGNVEKQWSVDYSKLVPYLVAEVKSLRARVAALEAKGS